MLKLIVSLLMSVSLCLLVIVLNITTPASAGPLVLLLVFALFYITLLGIITLFMCGFGKLVMSLSKIIVVRRPVSWISFKKTVAFASVIAMAPVIIIGMQSIGKISIYGYVLVVIFLVIGCLYVSKKIK